MNEYYDLISKFDSLKLGRMKLPIYNLRDEIIEMVTRNQIMIILGETGSGKTTQIPQFLCEAGLHGERRIAVTQPRRIAAISMARRVTQEINGSLGIEVGYEIRFDKKFSSSSKIIYMTDGILLNHCVLDPGLSEFSVIIIDEAHERTVNTDVLMGLLKLICNKRKELRLIITSATLDANKFSTYFNNAPILSCRGNLFPVEVKYDDYHNNNYVSRSVELVLQIDQDSEPGDILVFLTGQDEIEDCYERLEQYSEGLLVLRLYAAMDSIAQQDIFEPAPPGQRKVILATNIAETSITVDGVRFVIDCGYVKQNSFDSRLRIDTLRSVRVSRAQADQRKGRAGRTAPGICHRLYRRTTYDELLPETTPDIIRRNLCDVFLKLVQLRLDPLTFDFIDRPDRTVLENCCTELRDLGFLDSAGKITALGEKMTDFPVDPVIGKVLLSSEQYGCAADVLVILSMLTEKNIFVRGKKKQQDEARRKKLAFHDVSGDHITLLNVYNSWRKAGKNKERWCRDNFIKAQSIANVEMALEQLTGIMRKKGLTLKSVVSSSDTISQEGRDCILRCLITGFYKNICSRVSRGTYVSYISKTKLFTHPASAVFEASPELVVYDRVQETLRAYMHGTSVIRAELLQDFPREMAQIQFAVDPTGGELDMNFVSSILTGLDVDKPDLDISFGMNSEVEPDLHVSEEEIIDFVNDSEPIKTVDMNYLDFEGLDEVPNEIDFFNYDFNHPRDGDNDFTQSFFGENDYSQYDNGENDYRQSGNGANGYSQSANRSHIPIRTDIDEEFISSVLSELKR